MVIKNLATSWNNKFFCTLFDQMNKTVEAYKKRRDGMTGETAIDYGILSRTPWEQERRTTEHRTWESDGANCASYR